MLGPSCYYATAVKEVNSEGITRCVHLAIKIYIALLYNYPPSYNFSPLKSIRSTRAPGARNRRIARFEPRPYYRMGAGRLQ